VSPHSAQALAEAAAPPSGHQDIIGLEAIMRMAYAGQDLNAVYQQLVARAEGDPTDAAALYDMAVVLQVSGHRDEGLRIQGLALERGRVFRRVYGEGRGVRVAALMTAGDFMANTPIEFLLSGSEAVLHLVYVDAATADLSHVPPHDVLFVGVGESPENQPVLARCAELLAGWTGPRLKGAPEQIAQLTRDGVAALLAGEPSVLAPMTVRASRAALQTALAAGDETGPLPASAFPLIVRPIGTHAGQGMEKLDGHGALAGYLAAHGEDAFYVAPFVDYAGPDGLFRKQRIAFIGGRAYPSHFAVSEHWMVHYLSARMAEDPARRAEEQAWMEGFDTDFAARHAEAFAALHRGLGLDYFGIDCAELPDGRLLVFEVDVAMIVHDLDPEDVFPYKKPAMRRLFAAFQAELERIAGRA
jgi:hypothetical protein